MNSKTKAVIDIGTNTFHLLIAEITAEATIQVIYKKTIAVKLGEGGVDKGFITDAAYQRGINALLDFRTQLDKFNIQKVKATATAAVRDASNGKDFMAEAKEKANIQIEIIDGLKEAEYIYVGAKAAGTLGHEKALIMDIGGGSVEFILCNQREIFWKNSFRLGAARLLAEYYTNDEAIKESVLKAIHQRFQNELVELFQVIQEHQPTELIGTAGSFDSYAEMMSLRTPQPFNHDTQKSYHFNLEDFNQLITEIISSSHQQRAAMKGLIPLRVDMILMASMLTQFIIERGNIQHVTTCTYSLKEGLLFSDN
ncbi:MAG: exopolyphosphatase [Sphingobacteriales bacterium]|nr:exopolyphosphatase [Sphingobacteriales bacterium]